MSDTVWVMSGPGIPCGARRLGDTFGPVRPGMGWLDMCMLGQHLPQRYRDAEIQPLDVDGCARLGLCPDCLGFGDLDGPPGVDAPWRAARGVDEVARPCPNCAGSGRPAVRVTVVRDAHGGVQGTLRPIPHAYVPPLPFDPDLRAAFGAPADMCLACGMPKDGTGPHGEQLHL